MALFLAGCHPARDPAVGPDVVYWGAPSPDEELYEKPVADPRKWSASDYWDSPERTAEELTYREFEADIDHDGVAEFFITFVAPGNAGSNFDVFRRDGEAWRYIGSLFCHPKALRVLPLGPDRKPRIFVYWRCSSSEGTLAVLTSDGRGFPILSKEVIHPGDGGTEEGRRRYREAFGY